MPRRALLAIFAALAGCDAVFGSDYVPSGDGGGDPTVVTIRRGVRVIEPDEFGGYREPREQLLGDAITVIVNGEPLDDLEIVEPGVVRFRRPTADTPYRVRVITNGVPTVYDETVADPQLFEPLFGRVERAPITQPTTVTATFAANQRTSAFYTTGIRSSFPINSSPTAHDMAVVDLAKVNMLSGTHGLPDAEQHFDRFYYVQYDLVPGQGYTTIHSVDSKPLTMLDGDSRLFTIAPSVPDLERCVRLTASRESEQARMAAAYPAEGEIISSWAIEATPNPAATPTGGIVLAMKDTNVMPGSPDIVENIAYYNPFLGERQIVRLVARTNAVRHGTAIARTDHMLPLPLTETCSENSAIAITGSVALPQAIHLDGAPATGPIAIGDGLVTFTTTPGAADLYVVALYRIENNARVLVARYAAHAPQVRIDPQLVEPGLVYELGATVVQGLPDAAIGDYRTTGFPFGSAFVFGGPFTKQ